MGQVISAVRQTLQADADEQKRRTLEQLRFLEEMAASKLDTYEHNLNTVFRNPESLNKIMIVGNRAMRYERKYTLGVSEKTDQGVMDAIDCFFPGEKEGESYKDRALNGRKSLVKVAFNAILGNSAAGEQEDRKFFVFIHNNSIVRVDVCIWRYNFTSSGIMANAENVFCYLFCLSVVDRTKVTLDEIMFLISETVGGDLEAVTPYVQKLSKAWALLDSVRRPPTNALAAAEDTLEAEGELPHHRVLATGRAKLPVSKVSLHEEPRAAVQQLDAGPLTPASMYIGRSMFR